MLKSGFRGMIGVEVSIRVSGVFVTATLPVRVNTKSQQRMKPVCQNCCANDYEVENRTLPSEGPERAGSSLSNAFYSMPPFHREVDNNQAKLVLPCCVQ